MAKKTLFSRIIRRVFKVNKKHPTSRFVRANLAHGARNRARARRAYRSVRSRVRRLTNRI